MRETDAPGGALPEDPTAPGAAGLETTGMGPVGAARPRLPWWRYAVGLAVLLAFLFAGNGVASLGRLPLPGSVVGMLLLAGALRLGWVRVAWVEPAAALLLRHMALLFVPPGVGLMVHFALLRREWLPIVVASAASTLAVMLAVGWLQQRLEPDG